MTRLVLGLGIAAAGAAAWLVARGHRDPRRWPQALASEGALLRRQLGEAVAAGKRAAARREQEIEREMAEATRPGA
ncbi:MAG: hypothetical protein AB1416_00120 [Actinomycetota bacterium]